MPRILYCNIVLANRSGTEVVTMETTQGLCRLGYEVAVLVSVAGPSARQLRERGIPVVTSVEHLPWRPDLVHTHHLAPALSVARHFPEVPQVFTCHDATALHSTPPQFRLVRKYLAVDRYCAERIRREGGEGAQEVTLLPNAVDLNVYCRRAPLPAQPRRVLLLTKNREHVEAARDACRHHHLSCDELGPAFDREVSYLAEQLQPYDIVIATARMALEAMAVGNAVLVADGRGLAGMVTADVVDTWREFNFGAKLLTRPTTAEEISAELQRYLPEDAERVTERIRDLADQRRYLAALDTIYREVLEEQRLRPLAPLTPREFNHAFAAALPVMLEGMVFQQPPAEEIVAMFSHLLPDRPNYARLQAEAEALRRDVRVADLKIAALQDLVAALESELATVQQQSRRPAAAT